MSKLGFISALSLLVVMSAAVVIFFVIDTDDEETEHDDSTDELVQDDDRTVTDSESDADEELEDDDRVITDSSEEDTIRLFFSLINEQKISQAVGMMSENMVGTDPVQANSAMQQWGVVFSTWNSVTVDSIEKSSGLDGTAEHLYIVVFSLSLSPDGAQYQWDDGKNTRWISLVKVGEVWKIDVIATGM